MFKKIIFSVLLQMLIFFFLVSVSHTGALSQNEERVEDSLLRKLQEGGYILYIRHGETTGQDKPNLSFNDCSTQKNLNEIGKKHAKTLGTIFEKQKIPVDYPVLTSPYCRTRETAEIAFEKQNMVVNENLAYIYYLEDGQLDDEQKKIKANIIQMLETQPRHGTNKVIVGHSYPFHESIKGEIPNLGTVVLKPKGQGNGFEFVALIKLEDWIRWSVDNRS
ncbi:histidine phosphatase family protein [Paenibacillus alvei]|uniref:histidine phosphatase family protein n=1 Tax=Paenibacillus alvei TaxID=44250 RepID=UPI0018CC958A|nr:histidine phosphatase family protein [Paenibacillus alvei]MBG9735665.1 hypothetical protein [Paenibacillus alvei]MBG9746605.1 hypothetical protein [Paenibacillus alvei]MCY9578364.1 histidine phosphatase family protein [Paenibacillus alvei]MCY9584685.1 histidine phosphatase family protein [Paenibacillus alvei]